MQKSLTSRLEALEAKQPSADAIDIIIRAMVAPGPDGAIRCGPIAIHTMRGDWRIARDPGEDAEAFEARAVKLCPRIPGHVVCLVEEVA
jgi:hypothetical protein